MSRFIKPAVVCIFCIIFAVLVFRSLRPNTGHADIASAGWDFNTPSDYLYDLTKIEVIDGVARLLPQMPVPPMLPEPPLPPMPPMPPLPPEPPMPPLGGPSDFVFPPDYCFATIESLNPIVLPPDSHSQSFIETADVGNGGVIGYQVSIDNGPWLYWNNLEWVPPVNQYSYTRASEVSVNLGAFPAISSMRIRAEIAAPCTSPVNLIDARLEYSFTSPGYGVTTNTLALTITDQDGATIIRTLDTAYVRWYDTPVLFVTPADHVDISLPAVGAGLVEGGLSGA